VARYVPLITEDEYILAEERAVLEKFGDAKTLALAMVRNGHLTDSDVDELRDYFKMGGDGNGHLTDSDGDEPRDYFKMGGDGK
jgi:predicted transcriptional regulator